MPTSRRQRAGTDRRRVGEQQQGQRHLSDSLIGSFSGSSDQAEASVGHEDAYGNESECRADRDTVEAGSDEGVATDQKRSIASWRVNSGQTDRMQ